MTKNSKSYLIYLLWFLTAGMLSALPSREELGKIFGYPESEIVVTDVTAQERQVFGLLSARERRAENPKVISESQLIAAYRVSAKDPETFYPIIISIGKEGTFLTNEVRKILTELSAAPEGSILDGGRGPLGNLNVAGAGESGVYMGKVKRPSRDSAMSEPQERMALISVMHLAEEPLDLRIAFMAALEKGSALKPVVGGERYFRNFAPSAEESNASAFVVRDLVSKLNKLVLADGDFPAAQARELLRTTSRNTVHAAVTESSEATDSSKVTHSKRIWVAIGAVVLLLIILNIIRKKNHDNV